MYSLIIRHDLIREKCISFNEETQYFIGGICMSKIFTWIFGLQTGLLPGFIGGIMLIAGYITIDPDGVIEICEKYKKKYKK